MRRRRLPVVGSGEGRWSFTHIDDAAGGVLAALAPGGPTGMFAIVDDEPARTADWLPALATAARRAGAAPRPGVAGPPRGGRGGGDDDDRGARRLQRARAPRAGLDAAVARPWRDGVSDQALLGSVCLARSASRSRSSIRRILPVSVLGKSSTNSTRRGYA